MRVRVDVGLRSLLLAVAVGAVVLLAVASLGVLLSIAVAMVIALGLDPVVAALVARGWPRAGASIAVFVALFAGVFALVLAVVGPLWEEVQDFARELPGLWDELARSGVLDRLLPDESAVRGVLEDAAAAVPDAAGALLGAAGGAFGSALSLVTLTFLALFFLIERPALTDGLFRLVPPEDEARWRPVLENGIRAVSYSLLGNVAISLVAGSVAGLSAWALGLPFPVVLGVIAGLLDLIPQVGATIASILLVAVALTVSLPAAAAMLVIQLVYQQVENYVVYPVVYRRAVALSGFTTIVAVLVSSALLGVVGAILAVPVAAVVKVVLGEALRPRRERMAALRAGSAAGGPAA